MFFSEFVTSKWEKLNMSNQHHSSHFLSLNLSELSNKNEFIQRHIGPSESEQTEMLNELGFSNLDDLAKQVVPKTILDTKTMDIGFGISENDILTQLKNMMGANKLNKSLIGQGYYGTYTPTIIQRNILENPVWYTAYTPYQAEISQGRMESLLNFQTMIRDLTAMEIANASLLDEGTAAAEAMSMAHSVSKNTTAKHFFVSDKLHPQVVEVLKTRCEPLGLEMILGPAESYDFKTPIFAFFVQYPDTDGQIADWKSLTQKVQDHRALMVVGTDLLALTLLTPPGEWGADIVYGNSQRFGVPLGFGGPHAAFMSTKEEYKRNIPGRIIGVSKDSQNKSALRLALQTREQHIRREKATSNICTAQVLLANMAAMYAVYHGPQGLKKIAARVNKLTQLLQLGLKKIGIKTLNQSSFDTLVIENDKAATFYQKALKLNLNLRKVAVNKLGISLDETCDLKVLNDLFSVFSETPNNTLTVDILEKELSESLKKSSTASLLIPQNLLRQTKFLTHPVFNSYHSETELLRYIYKLQNKDFTLTHSMIPLGSCTMKLNATTELVPVSWPEVNQIHPFAPLDQAQGYMELIKDLEKKLSAITGFSAVSLQPNAGSQGEYAGLLVIREFYKSKGESHRNICLIPSSAHGTNPASAVMCGMQVVVVKCDEQGNVDISDLKEKAQLHKNNLAALMVTYPSTHGVFEEGIKDICQIIHDNGGQVYMDGANLNALVGLAKPGEFGPDVSHMNLHKTFAIPHGGGGPGVGPIGVREHLKGFLPRLTSVPESGPKTGITSTTAAPWGSASILPISWVYITLMGSEGLKKSTLVSILNANYIAKKLNPYFPVLYKGREGLVAHECIIDLRPAKKTSGVDVTDVAKRLMDYGFHAPTMSWPVAGTLMIEPTESESKYELDRFINSMINIHKEIKSVEEGRYSLENSPLVQSPHTSEMVLNKEWKFNYSREEAAYPLSWIKDNKIWPAVGRVDNAYGDRNLVCSCPSVDSYQS
ncbi:MAG: aminomethyl-transferring glycine dehydrogenase [Bdellovibrionaceae bacterium]|nr:aminomethyl-transferring glycine dehydrogenase [Pseudobdellovibrionaceae bacterium]